MQLCCWCVFRWKGCSFCRCATFVFQMMGKSHLVDEWKKSMCLPLNTQHSCGFAVHDNGCVVWHCFNAVLKSICYEEKLLCVHHVYFRSQARSNKQTTQVGCGTLRTDFAMKPETSCVEWFNFLNEKHRKFHTFWNFRMRGTRRDLRN